MSLGRKVQYSQATESTAKYSYRDLSAEVSTIHSQEIMHAN